MESWRGRFNKIYQEPGLPGTWSKITRTETKADKSNISNVNSIFLHLYFFYFHQFQNQILWYYTDYTFFELNHEWNQTCYAFSVKIPQKVLATFDNIFHVYRHFKKMQVHILESHDFFLSTCSLVAGSNFLHFLLSKRKNWD